MLPRGVVHEAGIWSVFDLVGSIPAISVVYAIGVLAVVAFTLGLQTRSATLASPSLQRTGSEIRCTEARLIHVDQRREARARREGLRESAEP
jgi:hypothetical protein